MAGGVSCSTQDSRRRVLVRRRQKNPDKERSSTELRFTSFPFPLCGRGETCQGSSMNALRAPLTGLTAPREKCCYFLLDSADVVIEGMLRQLTRPQINYPDIHYRGLNTELHLPATSSRTRIGFVQR